MRTLGVVVALLLLSGACAPAADPPEQLTPERRQGLEKKAAALNEQGVHSYRAGDYVKAIEALHEALAMRRALYPRAQFPDGHPDLAANLNGLGSLHLFAGEYAKAEPPCREALEMTRALFPK